MNAEEIQKLKYPIGRFSKPDPITREDIDSWITEIEALPGQIKQLVGGLDEEKLNFRYRPEGWNIRQVVHHITDSHFNSFVRFKLALTENDPVIKPYDQVSWADLPDGKTADVNFSLLMLEGLHQRWLVLLRSMTPEQFDRTFKHPEREGIQKLSVNVGLYAWHGKHHLAHIKQALESGGKY